MRDASIWTTLVLVRLWRTRFSSVVLPRIGPEGIYFTCLQFFLFYLGQIVPPSIPKDELASDRNGPANVDLTFVIKPLQRYLLSRHSEGNFFTDPDSNDGCLVSLKSCCEKALEIDYKPWSFV